MSAPLRIVIADDHPVYRRGLVLTIAADPTLSVVDEVEDGEAALTSIRREEPDVVVLDVEMPKLGGFDVVRRMQTLHLATAVVFLTMHKDEGLLHTALGLGVRGYVLKDSAVGDIVASIKAAAAGEHYFSAPLASFLASSSRRRSALVAQKPSINDLTPTEHRILTLIADQRTSREIADQLFISVRTVERHRLNIGAKLDLHGSNALLKFALQHKNQLI